MWLVPYKAAPDTDGYDLYAAQATNVLPKSQAVVSLFSVQVGQRIAQTVYLKKFDAKFEMVQSPDQLDKSVRNEGGFGSTGNNWFF